MMNTPVLTIFGNVDGYLIIFVVVLLLFGGQKIPELMRGLGKGMGELRKGMEEGKQHFEQALNDPGDKPVEAASIEVKPATESLPRQESAEVITTQPEPHK